MSSIIWSVPAMCMVPTAETARQNKYVTTAGRIKFRAGQSGTIAFLAPVNVPLPQGEYFLRAHLERTVPDLLGTKIQLRRARRSNGAVSTLLTCVGVQRGPVQNNIRITDSDAKKFELDLDTYYYWVQVNDVSPQPATSTTVKAVLGVGLGRR
jgi:hypothetical protein